MISSSARPSFALISRLLKVTEVSRRSCGSGMISHMRMRGSSLSSSRRLRRKSRVQHPFSASRICFRGEEGLVAVRARLPPEHILPTCVFIVSYCTSAFTHVDMLRDVLWEPCAHGRLAGVDVFW